ncbi:MAG: hypothetical protein L3J30_09960 [Marinosulfonomonas sp.]|nr:hypothetical protein [Marinosulfonomonas sp.]
MARKLNSKTETDKEFNRIEKEAGHHAIHLNPMLRDLYDYVISRINFGRDQIEMYERNGNLARTTWVTHRGKRYVFTYDYDNKCVDLRDYSIKGTTLESFDGSEDSKGLDSKLKKHFY